MSWWTIVEFVVAGKIAKFVVVAAAASVGRLVFAAVVFAVAIDGVDDKRLDFVVVDLKYWDDCGWNFVRISRVVRA